MDSGAETSPLAAAPVLTVRTPDGVTHRFSRSFHIGRDRDCELSIQDGHVSRRHAVVLVADGHWSLRDLQSANGIYVDGRRVEIARIDEALTVSLGVDGPALTFELEPPSASAGDDPAPSHETSDDAALLDDYAERYFGPGAEDDAVGGRTMMIRKAFGQIQKRQKRRQRWVVAAVLLVALAAGGDQVSRYMEQRRQLEANYEQFVAGLSSRNLSEQERLILRVTRIFGDCDLAAPAD